MKVKILGISGSPRHGNTDIMVKESLSSAKMLKDVETEFISLADCNIAGGCKSTYNCRKTPLEKLCVDYKDDANMIMGKMLEADGILVGVPVYWGGVTAQLKALIDRTMPIEFNGYAFRNKVGGALTVAFTREGGHESTIAEIHRWFLMHDMVVVSVGPERPKEGIGCFWGAAGLQGWPQSVSFGSDPKGSLSAVKQDTVGMNACRLIAKRVVEMAKVIKAGFSNLQKEELVWQPFGGKGITFHPGE
jgi:multimeric flavodoxin WrbA